MAVIGNIIACYWSANYIRHIRVISDLQRNIYYSTIWSSFMALVDAGL